MWAESSLLESLSEKLRCPCQRTIWGTVTNVLTFTASSGGINLLSLERMEIAWLELNLR